MRDRLRDMIANIITSADDTRTFEDIIADELIANGVIVPPCKVGDFVFFKTDGIRIYPLEVTRVIYDTPHIALDERAIGRSIFLTREKAEQVLKEAQDETEA